MIVTTGNSSPLHAMLYRKEDGSGYLMLPFCVFCVRQAGPFCEFGRTIEFSAAYVCAACIEKRKDGPNANLSIAVGTAVTSSPLVNGVNVSGLDVNPEPPRPSTRAKGKGKK